METMDGRKIIDLSLPLGEEYPVTWPGHMYFQSKVFNYFENIDSITQPKFQVTGRYHTRWLATDEHTGTHFDAPAHFLPSSDSGLPDGSPAGDITADKVDISSFIGPACVISVTDLVGTEAPGISPRITKKHIEDWEANNRELKQGDIVLFRADWDYLFFKKGYEGKKYCFNPFILKEGDAWPAPSPEAVKYLVDKGIACAGTDGPSMGPADSGEATHTAGLGKGIVFLEGMANLRALPATGAQFIFLPIRLLRGSGAPGRAIALI